jgi:flagellar biosynthesis/type III secretory pathway protein FliH
LYFLRHAEQLDLNVLPKSLDMAELRWALGDLMTISQNKVQRERYESRLKMQRDVYTALAEKLDEGLERGRDEGRAEGRAEHIQFLQKSLRQNVTPLEELRSLSAADLQSLAAQLERQLDARLANGARTTDFSQP